MGAEWELAGYEVLELLGFGATGEVWRAREEATGDVVALKRLRPGADPSCLVALRREAALLRSLDTPYVVRLRALVGDVLVLDHAAGGSLASLLAERSRLDPGEVVTVAAPLAEALAAAHAGGLVHGDVSPSNVLFTADGMPLLADLGVARFADAPAGAVDGTAEYVDPAVAAGGDPTPASDVWALAAVCHHLLSGTAPHDGGSVDEVLDAARSGGRAPLGLLAPTVPRALVGALEQGLAADPGERPDAAAFALLLRRSCVAEPVRLSPPTPAPAASRLRETHRVRPAPPLPAQAARRGLPRSVLLVLATAVGLGLAAGTGWLLGQGGDPGGVRLAAAAGAAAAPGAPATATATASPRAPSTAAQGTRGSTGGAAGPPSRTSGSGPVLAPPQIGAGATATRPTAAAASPPASAPARPTAPATARTPTPGAAGRPADEQEPDWKAVLEELDRAREEAFATPDEELLATVYAPGAAALAADTRALRALTAAGRSAVDVRHDVISVQRRAYDGATARLAVRDVLLPHLILGADGRVVERRPGRAEAPFVVTVVATDRGWRLRDITAG